MIGLQRPFETLLGAIVLAGALIFLGWAVHLQNSSRNESSQKTEYMARFSSVAGLNKGADIRIGGIQVGEITNMQVDPILFEAVITLAVDSRLQLPSDSMVTIASSGLLGQPFVRIVPGDEKTMLQTGESFRNVTDPVSIEQIIGQALFLVTDSVSR